MCMEEEAPWEEEDQEDQEEQEDQEDQEQEQEQEDQNQEQGIYHLMDMVLNRRDIIV